MIESNKFLNFLKKNHINFFTGVPDSLLKDLNHDILKKVKKSHHFICANEGTAVSVAAGYNLATGKIPAVYLQNAGLGNLINPLTSLIDKNVYSIPMLILVGWRGEKGSNDEPQHNFKGKITLNLLKIMKQKFQVMTGNEKIDFPKLKKGLILCKKYQQPLFLVIKKNIFNPKNIKTIPNKKKLKLSIKETLEIITKKFDKNYRFVSNTGKCSRELNELRKKNDRENIFDFYNVGAMGHVSQISLGISLFSKKKILCLDGDGSLIMHMGGMSTIGFSKSKKLIHILLNNFCHDSVGGQPTSAITTNFRKIASACGYKLVYGPINSKLKLINVIKKIKNKSGPIFIEIHLKRNIQKKLSRPDRNFINLKNKFMKSL